MKLYHLSRLLTPRQRRLCYMLRDWIRHHFNRRTGRPRQHSLLQHIVVFMVKGRLNLPYRILEQFTGVCYVTLLRMVRRMTDILCQLRYVPQTAGETFVVDSTTFRIGREGNLNDYTGYKHMKGLKFQVISNMNGHICSVSKAYPARWNDKRIFMQEQKALPAYSKILGDKAYVGLQQYGVVTPEKRNHRIYRDNPAPTKQSNKVISQSRIVIEHVFASIKRNRLFYYACYFSKAFLNDFFAAVCWLDNFEKAMITT